ncbi:GNAT family N-acetyltransferase [Azospirillum sp. TSO35-2]|uniref:GNAT family N-acetyltransferase n=1 Tax=Azospirillum sp. TSO35-2 TaxID=716796 RepID=UPI000D60885E|nr:GNAT family N-acetyltransferase [Azospirillum sp. TSO35-2]PWC40635.1 hypothetical protein TSO352_00820 [Azospirillum sp. TSO35-2]
MERVSIHTLDDTAAWSAGLERIPNKDLTHYPRFSRIYQEKGDGLAECFQYQANDLIVLYPYIRRPLAELSFLGESWAGRYDLVTPYCYGGYVHNAGDERAPGLIRDFRAAFSSHCRETGVVSEFIRFHPMLQNHRHGEGCFDRLYLHQNNVLMDLRVDEAERVQGYRESYIHCIRKASAAGLRLELDREHNLVDVFAELYRRTMERHNQTGYLNLPHSYFLRLFENLRDDILLFVVRDGDDIAAASIFLRHGDVLDYFLSASDLRSLGKHPNHFMIHEVASWAHDQGYRHLHLGGGRASLVFFKQGFSKGTCPYHIVHHVHDQEAYRRATEARRTALPPVAEGGTGFFPTYREGLA